ncbi:malonyl-CoA decarboxylase [Teichococcus vastitatis]|uniref:Malonyl-CoA decarboxylase n=1 Tax=Teichococcus vastitatis TaxID=2307076 RepID=A0ABS9W1D8_9PROT|nr:malonyl-CoA decarboxylase [Pseudoroseomonas vastitatis]MCI0752858.1 malonyl-CoA decarboxylase [Pseudoroseomonas vastitatis]
MATSITMGARTWLERLWAGIADRGRPYADVPAIARPPLVRAELLARALLSERGEASGAAVARELLSVLHDLNAEDRAAFRALLASDFLPDEATLRAAAQAYLDEPSAARAMTLFEKAEPPRQELLRRMNMATGGTAALVQLRQELLGELKKHPELKPLDADLQHLFASWFNRGFLELRRIDWDTPAAILEKLIDYEAVHEIMGWQDLRRRLAPDRRCFAFFHRALPGEPLIFVEVALTQGLAGAIQPLLAPQDGSARAEFDTAIFYSISNCQEGLRGVSFGNFLIKQVVEELKAELPEVKRFSTLSPVPGFRRWLKRRLDRGGDDLFRAGEEAAILALHIPAGAAEEGAGAPAAAAVLDSLATGEWWIDPLREAALRPPLLRLAAEYLTRPNTGMGNIDPVARFHLGNGARLERINWLGNTAARGMTESYGVMVNYLYDPDSIEANHEAFTRSGTVARSAPVDALLAMPAVAAGKGRANYLPRLLGGSGDPGKPAAAKGGAKPGRKTAEPTQDAPSAPASEEADSKPAA